MTVRTVAHGLPLKRTERAGPAQLAYLESGRPGAPPVVFLHGLPTHSYLWRHVMFLLGDRIHGLAPDLMGLGDTAVSPYEDLSPPMQAEVLLEWLDQRGLDRVAVVAHDQGSAVAHQLLASRPERVSHLALVDAVAYDNWPVPLVARVTRLARAPGLDVLTYALDLPRWVTSSLRLAFARAVHDPSRLPTHVVGEYLRPLGTPVGRERARRFLLAGHPRYTEECVPALRAWTGPAVVAWGADDPFLSPSWGLRLVDDLPGARGLDLLAFCGHLPPEERPEELAALVAALLERPSP